MCCSENDGHKMIVHAKSRVSVGRIFQYWNDITCKTISQCCIVIIASFFAHPVEYGQMRCQLPSLMYNKHPPQTSFVNFKIGFDKTFLSKKNPELTDYLETIWVSSHQLSLRINHVIWSARYLKHYPMQFHGILVLSQRLQMLKSLQKLNGKVMKLSWLKLSNSVLSENST